ncbi:hypothetical protein [Streptomyces lydicus]
MITGVYDRIGVNHTHIGTTPPRLKHHLESPRPSAADSSQRSDRPAG